MSWLQSWLLAERGRRLLSLSMSAFVLIWLLATLPSAGITDDDDFYAPAGIAYAEHLVAMLSLRPGAFGQKAVDQAYRKNSEHPPLAKTIMGLSYLVLHRGLGVMRGLDAARAGVCLLAALLAYLLASFAFAWRGALAACVSVLALFGLPRFFFHAHVATLDVPVATLYFATAYAFWKSRHSLAWSLAAGLIFGLALLTKLNAPFAVIPIVVFVLIERWRDFGLDGQRGLRLPKIPLSLLAMLFVGPLLFVALWPHLWFDTFKRIGAYLAFHLNHYAIYMYYFGHIYQKPFAPWHTPFVLALITTPLPILGLMLAGALNLRGGRAVLAHVASPESRREGQLALYLGLHLFTTIGTVAFLGSPKYGGVKLFLPFFPFAALLAGLGFDGLLHALRALWPRHINRRAWLAPGLAALLVAPGLVASQSAHPFGLSYYSAAIGGLRGATAIGFERQYYDVADKELAAWLSRQAPRGAKVYFEPNNKEYIKTYRWLARDGYLAAGIRVVRRAAEADYLVLTHERRWKTYPELAARWSTRELLYEKRVEGVPLYSVYRAR